MTVPSLPYVASSATSREAALQAAAAMVGVRQKVHAYVGTLGAAGATMDEVFIAFGDIKWQTLSPRFGELVRDGYLALKGERRPTTSGEQAEVYVAVGTPGVCPAPSRASEECDPARGQGLDPRQVRVHSTP